MQYSQDIPRICTALAEWGGLYGVFISDKKGTVPAAVFLVHQPDGTGGTDCLSSDNRRSAGGILAFMHDGCCGCHVCIPADGRRSVASGGWLLLCKGISFGGVCSLFGMAGICVFTVHGIWESVDSGDFSYCCIWGLFLDRG